MVKYLSIGDDEELLKLQMQGARIFRNEAYLGVSWLGPSSAFRFFVLFLRASS